MNKVELKGYLTNDVKIINTQNQNLYSTNYLGVKSFGNGKSDFIPVIAWNKIATFMHSNFKKGSLVHIKGRLKVDNEKISENKFRNRFHIVINEFVINDVVTNEKISDDDWDIFEI